MDLDITVMGLGLLRYEVNELPDLEHSAVLISTSMPSRAECANRFARSLVLNYDDITDPKENGAFNSKLASQAADFVLSLGEDMLHLYVVCDFGSSRSAAMAAAIMRYLGYEELSIWADAQYHPNTLVYLLMSEMLGEPASEEEIAELCRINEQAFDEALK